jgi:K+-transporting ATPase ATPase A chain
MNISSIAQYAFFLILVTALVKPAGAYLVRVLEGGRTYLDTILRPIERFFFFICRIDATREMSALEYSLAFVIFSGVGTLLLYAVLRLQAFLPGGPAPEMLWTPITPDLAMNTAISFSTTSTWQAYAGESTMKNLTQVIGLVGQNFLAGAAGLALGFAFIRGFSRRDSATIGNFWSDLVRSTLWVLLPLSLLGSLALIGQGVPMTFRNYANVRTVQGATQTIALGRV